MISKSPFLVYQYLLDEKQCERIARAVRVEPAINNEGLPESMERHHEIESEVFEKIKPLIPSIEKHYELKYRGTEHMVFQQFPANGKTPEQPHCENAVFRRKRWIKVKDRDLTGVLWLKDHQDSPPFDINDHVLGGKLEFPIYNFGLQPQRGTLVIYPSCERFISLTTPILVGELQCVRIHMSCGVGEDGENPWIYQPGNFPGDFRSWFANVV